MTGNIKIKAFTSYFFDKQSEFGMCKYTYTYPNGTKTETLTSIIDYDDEGVVCYILPGFRISKDLQNDGG